MSCFQNSPKTLMLASVLLHSALPAEFIGRLRSKEATEGATVTLCCELSKAAPVEWRKGSETLRAGDRVSLRQDGAMCELEIRELVSTDAGDYSCVCGQERTSASLTVTGKDGLAGSSGSLCMCPCLLCPCQPRVGTRLLCVLCSFCLSPACSPAKLSVQCPHVWVLLSSQMTSAA